MADAATVKESPESKELKLYAQWQSEQSNDKLGRVTAVGTYPDNTPIVLRSTFVSTDFVKPTGRTYEVKMDVFKFGTDYLIRVKDLSKACGEENAVQHRMSRGDSCGKLADPRVLLDTDNKAAVFATLPWSIIQLQSAPDIKSTKRKEMSAMLLSCFVRLVGLKPTGPMAINIAKQIQPKKPSEKKPKTPKLKPVPAVAAAAKANNKKKRQSDDDEDEKKVVPPKKKKKTEKKKPKATADDTADSDPVEMSPVDKFMSNSWKPEDCPKPI